MLPDIALLRLFDFYLVEARIGRMWFNLETVETWSALVHVCQKWRNVVFGLPRCLDLRLFYTTDTPVSEMFDIWPLLPIAIRVEGGWSNSLAYDIIAELDEYNDRIYSMILWRFSSWPLDKVLAAMQQPFPALKSLYLHCSLAQAVVVPASFLGGCAQSLQSLAMHGFEFPVLGLTKLLLSATHLVRLRLGRIPHSGYISPKAMATCLSVLTRLENLAITFESPQSRPDHKIQRPPSPACILPVLTEFHIKGASEYLDDLVARIDAFMLDNLEITFFHQLIFDTPHLTQFISHTPKFKSPGEMRVVFFKWHVSVTLRFPQTLNGMLDLKIRCCQSDLQFSSLAQVCSSSFPQPLILAVEHLCIQDRPSLQRHWESEIKSSQWLELLRQFTSVKSLYISQEFTPHIVSALQEIVGERVTEVLPALENLFLEDPHPSGPVWNTIEQFVASRQFASHPIVVSRWQNPVANIMV